MFLTAAKDNDGKQGRTLCARTKDGARTWEFVSWVTPEPPPGKKAIMLRDDGGGRDLGYVRTVQRPDGRLVLVYYFNDGPDEERYIAATIWDPGKP